MRDCPNAEIRDLLPEFVQGRLTAAEASRVQAHVMDCQDCAEEADLLREMGAVLAEPIAIDTAAITAAVLKAGHAHRAASVAPVQGRGTLVWRRAAAIATIAVGGISLAIVQRAFAPDALPDGSLVAPVATATAPAVAAGIAPVAGSAASTVELGFAGGVGDLADAELAELDQAITALETAPMADPETEDPSAGDVRSHR